MSSTILIRQWVRPHNRNAACHQVLKQSLSLKKVNTDTAAMVFENLHGFQSQAHSGVSLARFQSLAQTTYIYVLSRGIALPSIKYCGQVEMDVLGGARQVASQPFVKIIIDPELCITMLLEKLRKCDRSMGEWRDEVGRSNVPSVNSVHISVYTEATQTLLTWEL